MHTCSLGIAIVSTLALLGASGCLGVETEDTGQTSSAVMNGQLDNNDSFSEVVFLRGDGGLKCSGTLITNRVVLTAAHCFEDAVGKGETDVEVKVGFDRRNPTGEFNHTFSISGDIPTRKADFDITGIENDDVARDIALVVLDTPVPPNIARPRRIPTSPYVCPSGDFHGTVVGYGRSTFTVIDNEETCGDGNTGLRRRGASYGWSRVSEPPHGSIYDNEWTFSVLLTCDVYDGVTFGDSGGALIGPQGNICAVNSVARPYPVVFPWPILSAGWHVENVMAAVDDPDTLEFLNTASTSQGLGIKDPRGNWLGECSAYHEACEMVGYDNCAVLVEEDADGDVVMDICDNCPDHFNPEQLQFAGDDLEPNVTQAFPGDGVGEPCDNCPDTWNPSQTDRDGDGLGDACDRCPLDPDPTHQDNDGDGWCESHDNCPNTYNPEQRNCNKTSELEHTPDRVWGDACDPVPCPDETGESYDGGILASFESDHFWYTTRLRLQDRLEIKPLRSYPADGINSWPMAAGEVATPVRFCQRDIGLGHTCETSFDIQDMRLFDADCAPTISDPNPCNGRVEDKTDPFHRIQFSKGGNGNDPNGAPGYLNYDFFAGSAAPGIEWVWDYEADIARWNNAGFFSTPPSDTAIEVFEGTLWLHASTNIGASWGLTGFHGSFLANHHHRFFKPADVTGQAGTDFRAVHSPFFVVLTLPDPGPDDYQRWDAVQGETNIIVSSRGEIGALDRNGDMEVLRGRIGSGLRSSLANTSIMWASTAEPFAQMSGNMRFPMAVGLTQDGPKLVETVTSTGDALLGLDDLGASLPHTTGSPNVHGYIAVLSQVARGVFIIGGDDLDTGKPSGQIWFHGLTDGPWRPVAMQESVGNVLAATYNFTTRELFVLDEIRAQKDGHFYARLLAVDPTRGATRVLGKWNRDDRWDQHWLLTDRDGSLLLASSQSRSALGECKYGKGKKCKVGSQGYVIARLDVADSSRPRIVGIHEGDGPLAFSPVVDVAGYTVVTKRKADRVSVRRWKELPLDSEHVLELFRYRGLDLSQRNGLDLLGWQL